MNHPAAYTPLESLFLFQSLLAHGVDTAAFARTSELLKGNALIRGGATYDPTRLTPDSLQQLFLLLLREELRSEGDRAETSDAPESPGSRKRKLASPPLPTLAETYEQIELVPGLVDRLYSRYRDHVVKQVREDERRFAAVQKEIQLLERSEKERLVKAASQNVAPTLAPRDGKGHVGNSAASVAAAAAQRAASAIKRGPTPNTPVYPPKPPTTGAATPIATTPVQIPPGPPPARPVPLPKPVNGSAPVLQAPSGVPQPASGVLQPPGQPPKPTLSPRPDAGTAGQGAAVTPQAAIPGGSLKWERPYQPLQSTPGQQQSGPLHQPSTPTTPVPLASQKSQQAQKQQPPPSNKPPQTQPSQRPLAQSPATQIRPSGSVLVTPQSAGQSVQTPPAGTPGALKPVAPSLPKPAATTQAVPPGRPIQPQQVQQNQRPLASATPIQAKPVPGTPVLPSKWPQTQGVPAGQRPPTTGTQVPLASLKDKPYSSPYDSQQPRPAIPEHIIRQAATTPSQNRRINTSPSLPQTPQPSSPVSLTRGFGTKWAPNSTPSTPRPIATEPESPAFEPVSPPQRPAIIPEAAKSSLKKQVLPKSAQKLEPSAPRGRGRPPKNAPKPRAISTTPSAAGTRRSQSVVSQTDELSMDFSLPPKIKYEESTPRPTTHDDAGDTTADESVHGRPHLTTPGSVSSRLAKRKRQETPPEPPVPLTHVLWTRGFTKVSSSALDQISSHRDANMFATALRERDAPNYRQIVLQPQDITSIRSSIKQGNKAAVNAAASLPGGDPGTPSVWLPASEDLVPPKGIINSAHLERELVHMFCNAIMYNPDPDRGPGPAFVKRDEDDEDEVVGYRLDENGVVKNTRSMFLEVEKLLGDLRSAEKQRGVPPLPAGAIKPASVATPAEDTAEDEDELAGDGEVTSGTAKRRRIATRG